jgi:hypothetical protein
LAGIGSPVPLGQDRSKVLLPGANTYQPITKPKSTHENVGNIRNGSDTAKNSVGAELIYDPFHVNAQRYADW